VYDVASAPPFASDISRIDANIEIMATSQGYPCRKEERIVSAFERKVS